MSKSLKLFSGAMAGTAVVLGAAYFEAHRAVSYPEPQIGSLQVEEDTVRPEAKAAPVRVAESHQMATDATPAKAGAFGLGRPATQEEVHAWTREILPDGSNLPVGSGSVEDGDAIFADNCAVCHGDFAEGRGNWPKLAGGQGTLADKDPLKTVGSYWPYLSTTFDYVRRSMPFGNAQSLTDDDVYAIVAYILYSNDLVADDFVLSNETFMDVQMPNADGFIVDDRETAEKAFWQAEPCMTDCKENVEITMHASVLDVTPDTEDESEATMDSGNTVATEEPKEEAAAEPKAEDAKAEEAAGGVDMALAAEGEKVFKKCKACHQVGEGAANKTGPELNGVVGRPIGGVDGFRYSADMKDLGASGETWTEEHLATFLAKPKDFVKRTKMSFAGLKKDDEIKAVIEFLKSNP